MGRGRGRLPQAVRSLPFTGRLSGNESLLLPMHIPGLLLHILMSSQTTREVFPAVMSAAMRFTTCEEEPSGRWCCNLLPTPASLPAPASQQPGWVLAAPSSMLGAVSWGPLSAVHTDQTWSRKAAPSGGRAPQACGPHCSKSAYGPWKLLCVHAQLLSHVQLVMTPL